MTTIKFRVPDEVQREFEETFARDEGCAVITELMKEAVAERKKGQRRRQAARELRKLRAETMPALSDRELNQARREGRP